MPNGVLALNINGDITMCTCPPNERGKGRCNHIAHQENGETPQEFTKRIEELGLTDLKIKRKPFIPYEGADLELSVYRISDEEKMMLTKIESRIQLDQNIDGGYIELNEPLWNDMDKNYFSQMSGITVKNIDRVLHGDCIILNSDVARYPEGKVISAKDAEIIKEQNPNIEICSGVEGMNKFAKDVYNWQATKDVYVLPYYQRMGVNESDVSSDITIGYKYLLRNRANPDKQQIAYEALLNNASLSKDNARYNNGYRNKSLADEFAGKGGVFRACLSGSSVPYSARTVISPTMDMNYGEIKIPPAVAVDIFRPTLLKSLVKDGYSMEEIDKYFAECRVPQSEVKQEIRDDLERRIANKRVCMNRQPSLHTSSFQSFKPKISKTATTQIHPLYCKSYGADFDGDAVTLMAINQDSMNNIVDRSIGAENYINTHTPRNMESSAILPSKDALFGLLSILGNRTN